MRKDDIIAENDNQTDLKDDDTIQNAEVVQQVQLPWQPKRFMNISKHSLNISI